MFFPSPDSFQILSPFYPPTFKFFSTNKNPIQQNSPNQAKIHSPPRGAGGPAGGGGGGAGAGGGTLASVLICQY